MANANNDVQVPGVFSQVQSLIAAHIENLEKQKIEESKLKVVEADRVKNEADKLLLDAKEIVASAEKRQGEILLDIEEKESKKVLRGIELKQIEDKVSEKESEFSNATSKFTLAIEKTKELEDQILVLTATKEKAKKDADDAEKTLKETNDSIVLNTEVLNTLKDTEKKIEENVSAKEVSLKLLDDKVQENASVIKSQEATIKENESKKLVAQKELDEFLAENETKKLAAQKELDEAEAEVKTIKGSLESDKQARESDLLFIKQMNEINAEKNKTILYTKNKLKEIIAQVIVDADAEKAAELKTLLSMADKI